jgi:hypothetical protein
MANEFIVRNGLIALDNSTITGSLTVTGGITGSLLGIVSYALDSNLLDGQDSSVFATTGSNQFNGSQTITGSLTVTGQITAQTLNVQQVTSSIVYSSGSNIFGNSLSDTQQLTGSVSVTGSMSVNGTPVSVGTGSAGQVAFWDGTSSQTGDSGLFWDNTNKRLGVGASNPSSRLEINGATTILDGFSSGVSFSLNFSNTNVGLHRNNNRLMIGGFSGISFTSSNTTIYSQSERMRITPSGNVLINTITDAGFRLDVNGTARVQGSVSVIGGSGTNLTVTASAGVGSVTATKDNNFVSLAADGTSGYINYGVSTTGTRVLRFIGNGSEVARFFTTGNLGINTTTDAGFRLDVNGTARITSTLQTDVDAVFNGVNIGRGGGNISTNTRTGTSALLNNTTGNSNTASGIDSLRFNTTGNSNTADGVQALFSNTTGSSNTANGRSALQNNTTGNSNTADGRDALQNNTIGNNNTAIGFDAGRFIADGTTNNTITNNSVFLGASTKALADNQTNQIVIGHNAIGLGSNSTVIGNTSTLATAIYGNLLIGTTVSNAYKLRLNTTGTSGNIIWADRDTASVQMFMGTNSDFYISTNNTNGVVLNVGATSWSAYSDIRLKNITGKITDALTNVLTLSPIRFTLKSDDTKKERIGLIAQEIQKILPEAVDSDDKGMLSVRYTEIIPLLVASIQEQQAQIEELKLLIK